MTARRPEFRGVRAVMIFSADPGASAAWWSKVLGQAVRTDGDYHWLDVAGGVELGFHPADQDRNPAGASTVAYWWVDSVQQALDVLIAAGGELHRGPLRVDADRQIAQVRDPFGAVVGLDGP